MSFHSAAVDVSYQGNACNGFRVRVFNPNNDSNNNKNDNSVVSGCYDVISVTC